MMPVSELASCTRICGCFSPGNTSMMRSSAWPASLVCSVANTRWPVSAIVNAVWIVSGSRISPTSMTSGSSRNAERSARSKESQSMPISRWLTAAFL